MKPLPSILSQSRLLLRLLRISLVIPLGVIHFAASAQPKLEFVMKKPKQFEERKLGSEKSAEKKFTLPRRFFQNTYTHYNYYFNGKEMLNNIISNATEKQKDDFTELLSFFPYSLKVTSTAQDLDSIIGTVTGGILLHDLRNDWIDNLYLLLGKTYLHRMDFDSAIMAFQFLNFSYAPKEKGGYDQPIGSNSVEGSNALSISTREKMNLPKKIFSLPPSRNESFVWMIRTLTEQGNYIDAFSLLSTLRNDPVFPERLKPALNETAAFLFYCEKQWDSAAHYLEASMSQSTGMNDKARRYFLAGQLWALAGNYPKASEEFKASSKMAIDPIMDIYARLNTIRLRKSEDPAIIDENIAALKSLAKKDSYAFYRDIIYYAAGLMEMERNGLDEAEKFFQQSIYYNNQNPNQRSLSWFTLGNLRYDAKRYGAAAQPYDSANTDLLKQRDSLLAATRRPGTKAVSEADAILFVQDSLDAIAALPEAERTALVKDLSKKLRKQKGLKDEPSAGSAALATSGSGELFNTSGTWYFYDVNRRASGFNGFRSRFGDRPNVDNWRRIAAVPLGQNALTAPLQNQQKPPADVPDDDASVLETETEKFDTADVSFDNLYSRLPLTPEMQTKALQRRLSALLKKANALHEQIEDYPEAIKVYEQILALADSGKITAQSLFHLIHCYTKMGEPQKAAEAKRRLAEGFGNEPIAARTKITPADKAAEEKAEEQATTTYKQVYSLFLEGRFKEAVSIKEEADKQYGNSYWTPQLLYIETVYFLQSKQDSLANKNLDNLIRQFPNHPLAARAKLIKEILPKRKQIEEYLTKLEVTRLDDDEVVVTSTSTKAATTSKPAEQNLSKKAVDAAQLAPKVVVDSTARQLKEAISDEALPYNIRAAEPQIVAIVLENIDPAYVNEVTYSMSNSPLRNSAKAAVVVEKKKLRDKLWLVLLRSPSFTNATDAYAYVEYIQPVAQKNILPWLDATKYRYILLSEENLSKLIENPTIEVYESLLKKTYPGKF